MEVIACSLSQFVARYVALSRGADPDNLEDYVQVAEFGLRGYHEHQHSISALNDLFVPDVNFPTILRDYDSLLGFSAVIPLAEMICLYTVFNPALTLTESIHLKLPFKIDANGVRAM